MLQLFFSALIFQLWGFRKANLKWPPLCFYQYMLVNEFFLPHLSWYTGSPARWSKPYSILYPRGWRNVEKRPRLLYWSQNSTQDPLCWAGQGDCLACQANWQANITAGHPKIVSQGKPKVLPLIHASVIFFCPNSPIVRVSQGKP